MILYRAMNEEEFQDTIRTGRLSWNSKFKWFGTKDFVLSRVRDGRFNNSKYVGDRYCRMIKVVVESGFDNFVPCGNNEYMLSCRKAPLVKLIIEKEI